ncbi:MAG: DUF1501 domain-containing protein, partial [Planctomycetaceae bacterium]
MSTDHAIDATDLASPAPIATRREFVYGLGASLGTAAFNAMVAADDPVSSAHPPQAPRSGHLAPPARNCIFQMMDGGPSHIDTFDPKPKLAELHL